MSQPDHLKRIQRLEAEIIRLRGIVDNLGDRLTGVRATVGEAQPWFPGGFVAGVTAQLIMARLDESLSTNGTATASIWEAGSDTGDDEEVAAGTWVGYLYANEWVILAKDIDANFRVIYPSGNSVLGIVWTMINQNNTGQIHIVDENLADTFDDLTVTVRGNDATGLVAARRIHTTWIASPLEC